MAPNLAPPGGFDGHPVGSILPAFSVLTRVHSLMWDTTAFNPTLADAHWGGGRFDATHEDPYGFIYAASSDSAAVSEALLRELPHNETGSRLLPRVQISSKRFGWMRNVTDLSLVSLCSGTDLAAVSQDTWLVTASSREYGATRRWAHAIRSWAPWAAGFVWNSFREPAERAYIFFEDRCIPGCFEEIHTGNAIPGNRSNRLDRGMGHEYLKQILEQYRVAISPN
jgi:hypothetical protein